MDLFDLKRLALAAREFTVVVGAEPARTLTLRLPTQHQLGLVALRSGLHTAGNDTAAHIVLQRNLLLLAVVGWHGVCIADVLPDHPQAADPLDFDPAALELWVDAHHDWEQVLLVALMARMTERKQVQDTAAKN